MDQDEVKRYYDQEIEKSRLELDHFKLEGIRTKEIIHRFLTDKKMKIADVGGGAGFYSFWLASLGHRLTLVDLSPGNIALVNEFSRTSSHKLESAMVGDATSLTFEENSFDIVLLMGPLYHLTKRAQRVKCLTEAKRVLKPGGVILGVVISRYASLMDGFKRDLIDDDRFVTMLMNDLKTGVHRNETDNPEYFTTSFFHTIQEIRSEVSDSGLSLHQLIGIEGAGFLIDDLTNKIKDKTFHERVQHLLRATETNEDLLPLSPHICFVAGKE